MPRRGSRPRVALEGQDLTTLFALIAAGSGIGLYASRPLPPAGVRQISLSPAVWREVGLVMRPGTVMPTAARDFADFVRERAGALAAGAPVG